MRRLAELMPKVLVVDDDRALREVMQRELTEHGMQVEAAESGREALLRLCAATLNCGVYDLVVLDIAMPEINGWRVLEAIKANPLWEDIRVVVLSGYGHTAQSLSRLTEYDGVFVEKKGDFRRIVLSLVERLVAQPS